MIFNAKSEPAVSPVIGTILLVAIAVVLVAVILAVVMGFSGDTNEKKVGLNAQPESGANATLILYGGASIPELTKLEMIDQDSPFGEYVEFWNTNSGEAYVGYPYSVDVARPPKDTGVYETRINVKGTFTDGTETILLIQPMTFLNVMSKEELDIRDYVIIKAGGVDITRNVGQVSDIATQAADGVWTFKGAEWRPKNGAVLSSFGARPVATQAETKEDGTSYSRTGAVGWGTDWPNGTSYAGTFYSGTSNKESGWTMNANVKVTRIDGSVVTLSGTWYIQ